jgi:hypothetical protein
VLGGAADGDFRICAIFQEICRVMNRASAVQCSSSKAGSAMINQRNSGSYRNNNSNSNSGDFSDNSGD